MDKIQECAQNFMNMVNTTSYVFHLANRGIHVVLLNFMMQDFHHLAGLQYLKDISIPKDKKSTILWILNKNRPITDTKNNSLIKCDYIIESKLKGSHTTVYIFLKHRNGIGSPCAVISFGVKKNVSYGGQNLYWMLKDKIVNGNRITLYQNSKYTLEQKLENDRGNIKR